MGEIPGEVYAAKAVEFLAASTKGGSEPGQPMAMAVCCKGLGVTSLKQLEILEKLQDHADDRKDAHRRRGALNCYQARIHKN